MDALKEGRCLPDRVPLHGACLGISGMDGLAMCKKCSPDVDPHLLNGWDQLCPTCSSSDLTGFPPEVELARPCRGVSSVLLFQLLQQPGLQSCLCSHRIYSWPEVGRTRRHTGQDLTRPAQHHSCSRPLSALSQPRLGTAERSWMLNPSHPHELDLEKWFGNGLPAAEGSSSPVPNPKTSGQGEWKEKMQGACSAKACCSQDKT